MTAVAQPGTMRIHTVRGGGGLALHVREWGRADGPPILLIHGWSQSHLCWARQYGSALADEFRLVAYDLRGHGMSEAPLEPEHYTDGRLWADDVAAIIQRLGLDRPVLVGWSYGGFIICDYLRGARPGRDRRDRLRRRGRHAGRGGVRDADRPGLPRPFRGRHRRRPADQHPGHARPGGRGGAPGDGRARPRHLPGGRALLVRRRRPHRPTGGARALQPRAGRPDPPRPWRMNRLAVQGVGDDRGDLGMGEVVLDGVLVGAGVGDGQLLAQPTGLRQR
jgi:pimeloyl-ACP methyl ester carboxylesterase